MVPPVHARSATVRLVLDVSTSDERWLLDDRENMPESPLHNDIILLLELILGAWVLRQKRDAKVGSNVAMRWDETRPGVGVDPDVYLVEPAPPAHDRSLLLWKPGHHPPRVAVEVVSETDPEKDYLENPAKYGASGTRELWIFDPQRHGPSGTGGPFVVQVWRQVKGEFRRVYAGDGPAYSRELRAWLVVTDRGARLRLASDALGRHLWLTEGEEERQLKHAETAAKEAERSAKEAEIAAKEAEIAAKEAEIAAKEAERGFKESALARVAELEARLALLEAPTTPKKRSPRRPRTR